MARRIILVLLILFWTGLCGPIVCSLLVGIVTAHNSGYKDTRLCPSIVLVYYRSTPCLQYRPGLSSCAAPSPHFSSSPSDSAAALSFSPYESIPSCSRHCWDIQYTSRQKDRSQRSRIGCILPPRDVDPNIFEARLISCCRQRRLLPYTLRISCLPVSRCANLCWNLIRDCSIWGFRTHVSSPKSNTACTTALKNNPKIFGSAPSRLRILIIRIQLFLCGPIVC